MPDVRLIDANALLDFISDERKEAADNKNHEKMRGNDYEMHFWSGALVQARWIRQYVNEAPTIDAVPVVHGRWVHNDLGHTYCSKCHERLPFMHCYTEEPCSDYDEEWDEEIPETRYCPNCGAKMDAEEG